MSVFFSFGLIPRSGIAGFNDKIMFILIRNYKFVKVALPFYIKVRSLCIQSPRLTAAFGVWLASLCAINNQLISAVTAWCAFRPGPGLGGRNGERTEIQFFPAPCGRLAY